MSDNPRQAVVDALTVERFTPHRAIRVDRLDRSGEPRIVGPDPRAGEHLWRLAQTLRDRDRGLPGAEVADPLPAVS